ncbi:manganese catalase family protein [Aminipila sp.]|uniref:manganese catalase family protein n=1 Tax=Aminipila sp. TaxID=2060095 RepID=UPI002F422514
MWTYDKKLQFPVNIKNPNPAMAKFIITQYGGPDGELGATLRYLSQRYTMPYKQCIGILNDIGISFNNMLTIPKCLIYMNLMVLCVIN